MYRLGIASYGISITTLEEVFLHINAEFGLELEMAGQDEKSSVAPEEEVDEPAEVQVVTDEPDNPDNTFDENSVKFRRPLN